MKRGLVLIILFCYMLGVTGLGFSFHYCGGELQDVSLVAAAESKCCCGSGKKMPDDCCKDKIVKIKKVDERQQDFKYDVKAPVFSKLVVFHAFSQYAARLVPSLKELSCNKLRPPPLIAQSRPLYILHSVFRI